MTAPVTRLILVAHGRTAAMRSGRFPGNEPLDDAGLRDLGAVTDLPRVDRILAGPEDRSISTARAFGSDISVVPALADLDYGRWSGLEMTDLPDADAMAWLSDPAFVPPGGESLDALFSRVEVWLSGDGSTPGRTLAVTSPAVVRAVVVLVLAAPESAFWRIDVSPLTRTSVSRRRGVWTIGSVAEKSI
ncbi:histidine phosphatase family protein [Rhodococcus sp. 077-4]|uniref:histidine phosphatase family protein n=1 Tax=Rhodococcus sp. 077-4 TaxID=2789271 RepID=UPI0039F535A3